MSAIINTQGTCGSGPQSGQLHQGCNPNPSLAPQKVKSITLSGKYIKFLVFGHWFVDRLAVTRAIDEATTEAVREQLELFAGVAKQTEMFDLFFGDLKDSTRSMKALIKRHNAPPTKEKKTRPHLGADTELKRGRKKKVTEIVHDKQDDLVAQIVAATQVREPTVLDRYAVNCAYGATRTPPSQDAGGVTQDAEGGVRGAKPPQKKKYVRKSEKKVEKVADNVAEIVTVVAEPIVETKKKPVKKTDDEKLADKTAKDAEKLADKTAKDAEKLAEKTAKDAEKTAKDAEKLAEKDKKDAEKLADKTAKAAEKLADKTAKDADKLADKTAKDADKLAKSKKEDKPTKYNKTADKTSDPIVTETGGVRGAGDIVATPAKPVEPPQEDELDVRLCTCSLTGLSYLVDAQHNLYHYTLHTLIGTLSYDHIALLH